jgi:hypothetical protein
MIHLNYIFVSSLISFRSLLIIVFILHIPCRKAQNGISHAVEEYHRLGCDAV